MKKSLSKLVICGTGTDVGKSYLSASLLHLAQIQGLKTAYFKPLQCGGDPQLPAPGGDEQKVRSLGIQTGILKTGKFLKTPCSPHLALRKENESFSLADSLALWSALQREADFCLAEMAGGLKVPISDKFDMLDLQKHLDAPCLLIASPLLGTLNHTLLSLEALQNAGQEVRGFVFCRPKNLWEDLEMEIFLDSALEIEKRTGTPFLGMLPWIEKNINEYRDWNLHPLNQIFEEL